MNSDVLVVHSRMRHETLKKQNENCMTDVSTVDKVLFIPNHCHFHEPKPKTEIKEMLDFIDDLKLFIASWPSILIRSNSSAEKYKL